MADGKVAVGFSNAETAVESENTVADEYVSASDASNGSCPGFPDIASFAVRGMSRMEIKPHDTTIFNYANSCSSSDVEHDTPFEEVQADEKHIAIYSKIVQLVVSASIGRQYGNT